MSNEQTLPAGTMNIPGQIGFYEGKVGDVYSLENDILMVVRTDRISAFDHRFSRSVPHKGQVLNEIACYFLNLTRNIVPNWLMENPHPQISVGRKAKKAFKAEFIVRGYLSGSLWRGYKTGQRIFWGYTLPNGLKENDKLPGLMLTPTAKTEHDEPITRAEIIEQDIMTGEQYDKVAVICFELFKKGTEIANAKGLILVDTKYEFGEYGGKIMLIDEVHTPDSSRYFYSEGYEERQQSGTPQIQLSKEFLREWLMERGFEGKEGQIAPELTDEIVADVSRKYIELYEKVLDRKFVPKPLPQGPEMEAFVANVLVPCIEDLN